MSRLQAATHASRHSSPHSSPSTSGRRGGTRGCHKPAHPLPYLLPIGGPTAARRAAVAAGEDHRPAWSPAPPRDGEQLWRPPGCGAAGLQGALRLRAFSSGCGSSNPPLGPRPARPRSASTLSRGGRPGCHPRAPADRRRLPQPSPARPSPAPPPAGLNHRPAEGGSGRGSAESRRGSAERARCSRPAPSCAGRGGAERGAAPGEARSGAAGADPPAPRNGCAWEGRGGAAGPRAAHSAAGRARRGPDPRAAGAGHPAEPRLQRGQSRSVHPPLCGADRSEGINTAPFNSPKFFLTRDGEGGGTSGHSPLRCLKAAFGKWREILQFLHEI